MTGFASVEHNMDGVAFTLALRSVNSRFLEIRIRLPKALASLEQAMEKELRAKISRGRLDVDLHILPGSQTLTHWRANIDKASAIHSGISEIGAALNLPNEVELSDIIRVGGLDLFDVVEDSNANKSWHEHVLKAMHVATGKLKEMRQQEGAALSSELEKSIQKISGHIAHIDTAIVGLQAQLREKLESRIAELAKNKPAGISSDRMEHEVLLMLDRADIREELVRLKAHLQAFEKARAGSDDTRGKRLDFLLQEILREVNTLGSKVPDAEIRNRVVDMKVLVEQLRQQVANVA